MVFSYGRGKLCENLHGYIMIRCNYMHFWMNMVKRNDRNTSLLYEIKEYKEEMVRTCIIDSLIKNQNRHAHYRE